MIVKTLWFNKGEQSIVDRMENVLLRGYSWEDVFILGLSEAEAQIRCSEDLERKTLNTPNKMFKFKGGKK